MQIVRHARGQRLVQVAAVHEQIRRAVFRLGIGAEHEFVGHRAGVPFAVGPESGWNARARMRSSRPMPRSTAWRSGSSGCRRRAARIAAPARRRARRSRADASAAARVSPPMPAPMMASEGRMSGPFGGADRRSRRAARRCVRPRQPQAGNHRDRAVDHQCKRRHDQRARLAALNAIREILVISLPIGTRASFGPNV